MAKVIAGEIDKMGILYEKYKKPLFAYFFKLTGGDSPASEDLVHTVFYRVIKYKSTFTGHGSFVNWLFRIAHNAGIDHNRSIKNENNYRGEFYLSQTNIYESAELENIEKRKILESSMSILNREDRELLILGKIDCLKYKEIADIMGTSENNIKIKIFRALKKLKEIYSKLENSEYEKAHR
jgi:RNA polymerase sigma-70 factor (ECF subfamily)